MYENLLLTEEDGILIVTINRPQALNAMNGQTMGELAHFFGTDAPQRTGLKGVILTGAGDKAFVAGADIKEFMALNAETGAQLAKRGQDVFFLVERFSKPVIAAVNGFALGGGCELAMACHIRVASERARFGQPEVNLGIIPGYGGTQRLVQHVGKGKALEWMMTGEMIGAAEAYQWGLVNHVVPEGEVMTKSKEILNKIGEKGPIAITKVIEAVNAYFDKQQDGFEREVREFGHTVGTADAKEGAGAFIEKRKPDFKGY